MVPDADRIHAAAQDFTVPIVAHLAENADVEPQHPRPSEMIKHYAADRWRFAAAAPGVEQDLLVGADDARGAVELIHHHATAADGVEFRLGHPPLSGFLKLSH